jgi:DNA-binding winged helix-turn-helix (wHTH) protein
MDEGKHRVYEFGGFQLDPDRLILLRDGEPVALTHKLFETLVFLVENRGRILERGELIQALWPESFVGEGNLSQNIFLLRKLLGDDGNGRAFIRTIPSKGYKFTASVNETEATMVSASPCISDYWSRHSPFRSLQVFEREDAWLFFARAAETGDLLGHLGRSPVLVMVGNSGSGNYGRCLRWTISNASWRNDEGIKRDIAGNQRARA